MESQRDGHDWATVTFPFSLSLARPQPSWPSLRSKGQNTCWSREKQPPEAKLKGPERLLKIRRLDQLRSCCYSVTESRLTLCNPMDCNTPGFLVLRHSWSLLKFMSIESAMLSNHLICCCPLLLLPSIFPSIKVFSNESDLCIRWPKYWSFSFNISPSSKYSGWFPLGLTGWISLQSRRLKSLLQHHSSKASILWHSSFFMLQLSHPYMTTGKTIPFTTGTFVGKVIPLLFNMLSIFVIAFLPRSKRLLISWLQSPSIVILEPKEIKSIATSTFSPSIFHEAVEPDAMILVFWLLSFKPAFSLFSFTLIRKLFSFSSLSVISHIICISEVVDISPDNSDSILWFIQANILLDVLCI